MTSNAVNPPPELDAREKRILTVTCFGHFMSHFNMLVFPAVLLPLTERMNADMASVLGLSFWMYLFFGLTALPWGLATDRWGAPPFLKLFYGGAGICGLAAAYWIDNPTALSVCLAGIGVFSGIYHPAGLGWISKDIRRVGLGMGYNGMFGNLGLAAAPFLAGLVNWFYGPRAVYALLGGLNLAGLFMMLTFRSSTGAHAGAAASSREDNGMLRAFLILLVAMMLGGVAYRGATVIMPAYMEIKSENIFNWLSGLAGQGLSKNLVATSVISVIYIIGMMGQYTGGRIAERFDLRLGYLAFHAVTVPTVVFMGMAADIPLAALSVIYFFFLLGMQPIENTLVAKFTPKKYHHAAFGAKFVLTFGVGSFAVKMDEFIQTAYGIERVFTALGGVSALLVGVIILLILNTDRPPQPA